jgi:hypothetical protein
MPLISEVGTTLLFENDANLLVRRSKCTIYCKLYCVHTKQPSKRGLPEHGKSVRTLLPLISTPSRAQSSFFMGGIDVPSCAPMALSPVPAKPIVNHREVLGGAMRGGEPGILTLLAECGVTEAGASQLRDWLTESIGRSPTALSLRYRGSRDGFAPRDFHRHTDNVPRLLVLVHEKDHGCIFGGFTNIGFRSEGGWQSDPLAFLFTLRNVHGIPPAKYPSTGIATILWDPSHAWWFGFGGALGLHADGKTYSYLGFNESYADTTGKGELTFAGAAERWQMAELLAFAC